MPAVAVARPKPNCLKSLDHTPMNSAARERPQGPATAAGALGYKGRPPTAGTNTKCRESVLLLYYLSGKSSRGYYGGNWYSGGKVLLPGLLFRSSFYCEFWSEFLATEVG